MKSGLEADRIFEHYVREITELSWGAHCLLLLACALPLFSLLVGDTQVDSFPGYARQIDLALPTLGWVLPLLALLVFLRLRRARFPNARPAGLEQVILLGVLVICVCVLVLTLGQGMMFLALVPVIILSLNYGKRVGMIGAGVLCALMSGYVYLSDDLTYSEIFFASVIVLLSAAYLVGGITEMNRNLASELDRQRAALKNLLDGLPLGICVVDESGKVTYRNPHIGEVEDRLCALLAASPHDLYDPAKVDPGVVTGVELEFEGRHYRVCRTVQRSESGENTVFILENVSETWRLEQEIRRSSYLASVGEMAAGVAHEIRNPLTVIRGYVQLLAEKEGEGMAALKPYFRAVLDEIDRLARIVQDFLNLARPQAMRKVPLDLNELLTGVRRFLETEALRRDAHLEMELDPSPVQINGDPAKLTQVVFNLVGNAFEAVGQGGKVWVRTYQRNNCAFLEVADNGPGIPEELREKVFTPFFSTRETGTGLGLAISRRVSLDHGGTLTCRSEPGDTRFILQIPIGPQS
jgi:signal transduction histidine kinase